MADVDDETVDSVFAKLAEGATGNLNSQDKRKAMAEAFAATKSRRRCS